jgi:hypothetical protein
MVLKFARVLLGDAFVFELLHFVLLNVDQLVQVLLYTFFLALAVFLILELPLFFLEAVSIYLLEQSALVLQESRSFLFVLFTLELLVPLLFLNGSQESFSIFLRPFLHQLVLLQELLMSGFFKLGLKNLILRQILLFLDSSLFFSFLESSLRFYLVCLGFTV